jgi:DNA repair protein RadA/Sms
MEAKKLGFERVILPKVSAQYMEPVEGIQLIGVASVLDALRSIS